MDLSIIFTMYGDKDMSLTRIDAIPAFTDNYIWALVNAAQKTVWVVDPGDAEPVIAYVNEHNLELSGILITHHHPDHCGGVRRLLKSKVVPVYGPQHSDIAATHFVKNKEIIHLSECGVSFRVLAIPGHTLEHVAYYSKQHECLFSGDTLFSAGCGRVFEGTMSQMYASLQSLAHLPDTTRLYCGHEYTLKNLVFAKHIEPDNEDIEEHIRFVQALKNRLTLPSNLAQEKRINPFLRAQVEAVRAAAEVYTGKKLPDAVDVFAAIRQCKDRF